MEPYPFTDSFLRDLAPGGSPVHEDYLRRYLFALDCCWALVEQSYFDRDFLAEFSAFYGGTAKGYDNHCRRVHFFRGNEPPLSDDVVAAIVGGDQPVIDEWQARYLGFAVIRPIRAAPFGRTVLTWFPERDPDHPRNLNAHREYRVHLLGGEMSIRGLAWQQQDTGVSACATVSLWTMFHAVAAREGLTVPTTVEITRAATQFLSEGRPFPSSGLSVLQLSQAIREGGLAPMVVQGDLPSSPQRLFGWENLTTNLATLLRAGFPVLVLGTLEGFGGHAVCAVGYRQSAGFRTGSPGTPATADSSLDWIYVHDDNVGPAVRIRLREDIDTQDAGGNPCKAVSLVPDQPIHIPARGIDYPRIIPHALLAAVPNKVRISSSLLLRRGLDLASHFTVYSPGAHIEYRCHLPRQQRYFKKLLPERMVGEQALVPEVCLRASREFQPMSRYIGVVTVTSRGQPLADFLWDTTDSPSNSRMFGVITFEANAAACVQGLFGLGKLDSIPHIQAFR